MRPSFKSADGDADKASTLFNRKSTRASVNALVDDLLSQRHFSILAGLGYFGRFAHADNLPRKKLKNNR